MFGQVISNAPQIIEGHLKEIAGKETSLSESRLKICRECPLCTETKLGPICDAKKCYNKLTDEVTTLHRAGNICGCGCRLSAKTRLRNARCVLGNW